MKKKNKIIERTKQILKIYSRWVPPKIFIALVLLVFSTFMIFFGFRIDNDFWFLINTGKYILNNGFPLIEPFTIHTNLEFMVQQWLTDIIFYLIYSKLGIYGMYTFVTLMNIIIILLIYKLSLLVSNNKIKISLIITVIADFMLVLGFITTRPQIFDIILLLIELYLLELYIKNNKKIYLIGLPIISLLMINLHSSLWLMIFVFLLPYYVELIIYFKNNKSKLKSLILITIVMFLVGIINPYGLNSIKYLFNSYGVDTINNLVGEMQPIVVPKQLIIFIYIFIVLVSFYYNKKNNKVRYLLLTLGTCYLALSHYKGVMFFIITSILVLSYNFKNIFNEQLKQETFYYSKNENIFIFGMFIIFTCIHIFNLNTINLKETQKYHLYELGVYLNENTSKDIKLYTNYNDGGYFEYLGYKCYIDPRAEVFLKENNKKEDIFNEYYDLQKGYLNYEEFLNKYNFDYLIVSEEDILYNYINDTQYQIIYMKNINNYFDNKNISYKIYKKVENEI